MKPYIKFICRECNYEWSHKWWEGMSGVCFKCQMVNAAIARDITDLEPQDERSFWQEFHK